MKRFISVIAFTTFLTQPVAAEGPEDYGLSDSQTNRVVVAMESMLDECRELETVYQPDCIGKALQRGASKIGNNSGYWEANVALTRASRGLERMVRQNADSSAGRERAGGYRIKAVNAAALPEMAAASTDILGRAIADLQGTNSLEQRAFGPIAELIRDKRPWP